MRPRIQSVMMHAAILGLVLQAGALHTKLRVGDLAPDLSSATWVQGSPFSIQADGRVKIVEFWATWCEACRESAHELDEIVKQYGDRVEVVGVDSFEDETDPFKTIPVI